MNFLNNYFRSRTVFHFVILPAFLFLFSYCKRPTANFTVDRGAYFAGDAVRCTNLSQDGNSFNWKLPDGSNSQSRDAVYFLPENTQPGTYHIQLEARSKAGVRKSFVSKPFTVWEGKGNVVVGVAKHKFNHNNATVKIFVNNVEKGVVPEITESVTVFDCNDPKCLTFSLPPGDYVVTATNGFSSQDRPLKIVDDFCVRVSFIF